MIYFSVCGFLLGYLWTRLFLAGAFRQADVKALGERVALAEEASQRAVETSKRVEKKVIVSDALKAV